MTDQEKYQIEYSPCLFELPIKMVLKDRLPEKSCPYIIIWGIIGIISLATFTAGLYFYDSSIDWFTTLYFVGGLGWVPAAMCGLSRIYHRMCQEIYPFLEAPEKILAEHYKKSTSSIFGYLKNGANVCLSVFIWILMLSTVIYNNDAFSDEYIAASRFIYLFYIFVAIIFACIPCAVVHFFLSLRTLGEFKLKNHALYQGAGKYLQKFHTHCTLLIFGITILLIFLSVAMLKSPYQEALWVWLPAFGFVPLGLFIMNNRLTNSLINTALIDEEATLQKQIDNILKNSLMEQESVSLYALLGIQDKLREHAKNNSTLSNAVLLLFTILGGLGSIVAAGLAVFSNEIAIQNILLFLKTNI